MKLSDDQLETASVDELRAAYRSLREHHIAETTALISRRDDLTRRRDDLLAKDQEVLAQSQKLIERADQLMRGDAENLDRMRAENARLSEIIDFMRDHYSPIGGRACALCVYDEGRFMRPCALHRWDDIAAKILASRSIDPIDPTTPDYVSDDELVAWADQAGIYTGALDGSYLRLIIDELRDRRSAEAIFAEVDRQFQEVACRTCDDAGADNCADHKTLVYHWRCARAALCDLTRLHRGYLLSLNAPAEGNPR